MNSGLSQQKLICWDEVHALSIITPVTLAKSARVKHLFLVKYSVY